VSLLATLELDAGFHSVRGTSLGGTETGAGTGAAVDGAAGAAVGADVMAAAMRPAAGSVGGAEAGAGLCVMAGAGGVLWNAGVEPLAAGAGRLGGAAPPTSK